MRCWPSIAAENSEGENQPSRVGTDSSCPRIFLQRGQKPLPTLLGCVLRQSSPKSPDQPPLLGGAQEKKKQKVWCALRARFLICRQRSACYAGGGADSAKATGKISKSM